MVVWLGNDEEDGGDEAKRENDRAVVREERKWEGGERVCVSGESSVSVDQNVGKRVVDGGKRRRESLYQLWRGRREGVGEFFLIREDINK